MNKIKNKAPLIILAIGVIFVLAALGFTIYALIEYSNKPITEVPFWAIWLMRGK